MSRPLATQAVVTSRLAGSILIIPSSFIHCSSRYVNNRRLGKQEGTDSTCAASSSSRYASAQSRRAAEPQSGGAPA
jgi:hypothetical protein